MRGKYLVSVGVAAALLVGAPVVGHAQETLELEPSSPWVVDYADESCALRREFGGPENPVVLQFTQFEPNSPVFQIDIVGPNLRWNARETERFVLQYVPDELGSTVFGAMRITAGERGNGLTLYASMSRPTDATSANAGMEEAAPSQQEAAATLVARAQEITGIIVSGAFTQVLRLDTRSLGNPMQAMGSCLDELMTHWGIDVVSHRTLQRKAQPADREAWARMVNRAFPILYRAYQGMELGQGATLTVRLDVAADGQISGCRLQQSIGEDAVGELLCRQIQRFGQLLPALDAHGQPIASYSIQRIRFHRG